VGFATLIDVLEVVHSSGLLEIFYLILFELISVWKSPYKPNLTCTGLHTQ